MSKYIKIVILTVLLFSYNSYSTAENNIRFIDVDYIYKNSIAGKKVNKQIESNLKKINEEFSNYKKELNEDQNKLSNQKNVLSKEELEKKSVDLETKVIKYNKIILKKKNELSNYTNNVRINFYTNLTKIVQDYATKNSIDIIIKKKDILIGKNTLDITQDLIKLFNENFKTLN
jgi:outer membrane protein